MSKKPLFNMPIIRKSTKKERLEKCERCGWSHEDHRFSLYCYHYSDQDTDYFYDGGEAGRKLFVPKGTKIVGQSFNGPTYATDVL